jgi:hypothetical protein
MDSDSKQYTILQPAGSASRAASVMNDIIRDAPSLPKSNGNGGSMYAQYPQMAKSDENNFNDQNIKMNNNNNSFINFNQNNSSSNNNNNYDIKPFIKKENVEKSNEKGQQNQEPSTAGGDSMASQSNGMVESAYQRENDLMYTQLNTRNPTSSSILGKRTYDYDASTRVYDPRSQVTAFERYGGSYTQSYEPNNGPVLEDLNNGQSKLDMIDAPGPIYPRPMYHYDAASMNLATGFSGITNGSKEMTDIYKRALSPSPITSTGRPPVLDLSAPAGSYGFNSQYYNGSRIERSPQPGASPQHLDSPQVPSPQEQTLDLSSNRMTQR